jgi:hypothetical protein
MGIFQQKKKNKKQLFILKTMSNSQEVIDKRGNTRKEINDNGKEENSFGVHHRQ